MVGSVQEKAERTGDIYLGEAMAEVALKKKPAAESPAVGERVRNQVTAARFGQQRFSNLVPIRDISFLICLSNCKHNYIRIFGSDNLNNIFNTSREIRV